MLTGSAVPVPGPVHSGAGRIVTVRMRPMALDERGVETPTVSLAGLLTGNRSDVSGTTAVALEEYVREIAGSGFPGLRHLEGRACVLSSTVTSTGSSPVSSKRRLIGSSTAKVCADGSPCTPRRRRPPRRTRRSATRPRAVKATSRRATTIPYREVLERLWILEPVPAWLPSRNHLARLASAPKHQLVDPALALRLLGADESALLAGSEIGPRVPRDGTLLGACFESLATLCVRVAAQASEAKVRHLRLHSGRREIDLIVERADHRVVAIEVKLARAVDASDGAHLRWLQQELGDDVLDTMILTTGPEAYRRPDGIAVVPLALLGP